MADRSVVAANATLEVDKGVDKEEFVFALRSTSHRRLIAWLMICPHRQADAVSQKMRKRVEEIFGWSKTIGGLRTFDLLS